MAEVAGIDLLNRQDDEHVCRAELLIDHRTVADESPEPQVALDQGGSALSAALASTFSLAIRSMGT